MDINKILNKDSISESEKLYGKRFENFSEQEKMDSLLNFVMNNNIKEAALKQSKDTYFHMPWKDFIDLIENNGFELQNTFKYTAHGNIEQNNYLKCECAFPLFKNL